MNQVLEIIKNETLTYNQQVLQLAGYAGNSIEVFNIDEDTKRYYPYSTLASGVIGFTGSDNQGLGGIESYYDDILKGKKGKILNLSFFSFSLLSASSIANSVPSILSISSVDT